MIQFSVFPLIIISSLIGWGIDALFHNPVLTVNAGVIMGMVYLGWRFNMQDKEHNEH
jgi:hypothetical protein